MLCLCYYDMKILGKYDNFKNEYENETNIARNIILQIEIFNINDIKYD